ncbi:MAG: hypothetical protein OXR66_04565 [Candidatus Woesearchaeota archaeon]|nr:hypothetical protein [Candidatus Woesearchaeota archaeon]
MTDYEQAYERAQRTADRLLNYPTFDTVHRSVAFRCFKRNEDPAATKLLERVAPSARPDDPVGRTCDFAVKELIDKLAFGNLNLETYVQIAEGTHPALKEVPK